MAVENGSESSPAVTVTGKKSVAPAKNRCTLATFDLPYITFYYNQKLLLYRAPDGFFPDAVARMTAALAEALRVFYPLAGRIRQEANGALIVEGDEGAEVVEAEAQGVSVDDLAGGACDEESERIMQDLVPYTGVMNLEGLRRPLLAVQVASCCISIIPHINDDEIARCNAMPWYAACSSRSSRTASLWAAPSTTRCWTAPPLGTS
jgi:BAHD acyltransferase